MKFKLLLLIFLINLSSNLLFSQEEDTDEPLKCKKEKDISKKAQKIFEKGLDARKQGNKKEAFGFFSELAEKEPNFPASYYLMGLMTIRDIEKEMKSESAQISSTSNIDALLNKAEKYFLKSIEVCPDYNSYCYFYLGKIYYTQGKYKEAIKPIKTFLSEGENIKKDEDFDEAESILKYSVFLDTLINKPVPFELKKVEGVSSENDEYLFCLSPDNEICFYTRVLPLKASRTNSNSSSKKEAFFVSQKDSTGLFDNGNEVSDPFNKSDNEGSPTITADNKYLVFSKCKMIDDYYNCDLYYSEFKNDEWSEIKNLGTNINNPKSWESQPSISADGKTLYFVSDRNGGVGGYDIWYSKKNSFNNWEKAQNIGNIINTPSNEKTPFIHADNETFYFSSEGHMSIGGMDIFYSKIDFNGKWIKPINIGYPINTEGDEIGFFVNLEGKTGFYNSNKSGNFDLFEFNLYEKARPNLSAVIKGKINSEDGEPIIAKIELKNTQNKKVVEIPVDDNSGKYAFATMLNTNYVLTVKKDGYAYESRFIELDSLIKNPTTKIDISISKIEEGKSYKLSDINFSTNNFELNEKSKNIIDEFIIFLKENHTVIIEIQGHTDDVGKDDFNIKLSENRAKSVYDYIISNGISKNRLSYKGYGKAKPIDTNKTEEGRAKNRRTVFLILKK